MTPAYILLHVSVTLHVIHTPPETCNAFPLVRHHSHANIEIHCVTLTFDLRTLTSDHVPSGPAIFKLTVQRYDMHMVSSRECMAGQTTYTCSIRGKMRGRVILFHVIFFKKFFLLSDEPM